MARRQQRTRISRNALSAESIGEMNGGPAQDIPAGYSRPANRLNFLPGSADKKYESLPPIRLRGIAQTKYVLFVRRAFAQAIVGGEIKEPPNVSNRRVEIVVEKILFVDDEPPVLEGYQRLLRREFAVSTAIGGYQGLAAIQANGPFAVVISDMRMPEMTGVEFLAQVRQKAPDSVRMLLTGHADFDAAIQAVNRGNIFQFLTKPCERSTLVEAIHNGLVQYRAATAQRELARKAQVIEHAKSAWDAPEPGEAVRIEGTAGLPGPPEARTYLEDHFGTDRQCYAVIIKLAVLHTVEERYGEKAAADYLMSAVQFLTRGLQPEDRLFQWSNDVLLAVIRRSIPPAAVRMEVSRLFMDCPQHLIEQGGRKTMVTITIRFDMLPVAQFSTLDEIMAAFKAKLIGVV
jgi:FixJ family two-component response regulator